MYVRASDGADLGWWDLTSGRAHPRTPQDEQLLAAVAAGWLANASGGQRVPEVRAEPGAGAAAGVDRGGPVEPPAPEPSAPEPPVPELSAPELSAPEPPPRPVYDLAYLPPGASTRARARAEREAAPVRTLFARLFDKRTEERAWRLGADGEEMVGAQLSAVAGRDPRWIALHAVPVGDRGSDIDHVVIGPGCVYTVNTKHHPRAKIWVAGDAFLVNGARQHYLRNSRHEASRAARLLSAACGFRVHVEPVIVPVNARSVVVKQQPEGVHVVPYADLARWLLSRDDFYPPSALAALYDAARRSTTWQP